LIKFTISVDYNFRSYKGLPLSKKKEAAEAPAPVATSTASPQPPAKTADAIRECIAELGTGVGTADAIDFLRTKYGAAYADGINKTSFNSALSIQKKKAREGGSGGGGARKRRTSTPVTIYTQSDPDDPTLTELLAVRDLVQRMGAAKIMKAVEFWGKIGGG
jgi:hypothetical protein